MKTAVFGSIKRIAGRVIRGTQAAYTAHPTLARTVFFTMFLLCVTYSVVHIYRLASIVSDENLYINSPKGVLITYVDKGGASDVAGLKVGDIILAVNNNPVHTAYEANSYIVQGYGGKKLEYTILRDGQTSVHSIVLAAYGLSFPSILDVLMAAAFYLLGALVFSSKPTDPTARLFGWACLSFAFFFSISSGYIMSFYPDLFTAVRALLFPFSWGFTMATVSHLLIVFPVRRFDSRITAGQYAAIYTLPTLFAIVWLLFPPNFWVVFIATACIITTNEILLRRQHAGFVNPDHAKRARTVAIAGWLAVVYMIARGVSYSWAPAQFLLPLSLFLPAAFFITIARYRVFGLYFTVRKSLAYSLYLTALTIVLAASYFAAMYFASSGTWNIPSIQITTRTIELIWPESLPPAEQAAFQQRLALATGGVLLLAVVLIYRRALRFLDEKFYRGTLDFKKAMQVFSTFATRFTDTGELAREAVMSICGMLHVKGAALYVLGSGRFHRRAECEMHSNGLPPSFPRTDAIHEGLIARPTPHTLQGSCLEDVLTGTEVEFVMPVFVKDEPVAVLALMQKQAETAFSREDVELLQYLATQMTSAFEVIALYDGVKEREHLKREFEIARRIQLSSLPNEVPVFPGLDIAVSSTPAYEVGGDFYDLTVAHPHLTIFIGDVSGKGTSAALHLSRIQGMIRVIQSFTTTLWELFVRLNNQAMDQLDRSSFVTLSALRIDLLNRTATFVRAGHLPMLHYRALTHDVVHHQPQGLGIGLDDRMLGQSLEEHALSPDPGDILVLMTDGITEAENPDREQFGIDPITAILRAHAEESAEAIKTRILEDIAAFGSGHPIHDDMTLVIVKFVN